jgi:hypothetical protein
MENITIKVCPTSYFWINKTQLSLLDVQWKGIPSIFLLMFLVYYIFHGEVIKIINEIPKTRK